MITVLSFGGGQDSTAILYKIIKDPIFRALYVKGELLVVMSDTGDEHDDTYAHVNYVRDLCERNDIHFTFIQAEDGFHNESWPDLITWMKRNDGIMSVAFPKACTDKLKLVPIYNWLDQYIALNHYYLDYKANGRKEFIKRYAAEHGRIQILLGIAKDEESRLGGDMPSLWMNSSLERIYPLVEQRMNRKDCQDLITFYRMPLPPPSNCKRCPFLSLQEILWLHRNDQTAFDEWVVLEQNKIDKHAALGVPAEKNLGVKGKKLLPQILQEAQAQFGHWSNEDLQEYRMSHGHCIKSKY